MLWLRASMATCISNPKKFLRAQHPSSSTSASDEVVGNGYWFMTTTSVGSLSAAGFMLTATLGWVLAEPI